MSCRHDQIELRKQPLADGRYHLRNQCLVCGQLVGSAQPHAGVDLDQLAVVDVTLQEAYVRRHREAAEAERQERHLRYEAYLLSPEWSAIREKVLKRDKYICQGCLANEATQVHHRGYQHCRDEFCWELVAICRDCHQRYHGPRQIKEVMDEVMSDIDERMGGERCNPACTTTGTTIGTTCDCKRCSAFENRKKS